MQPNTKSQIYLKHENFFVISVIMYLMCGPRQLFFFPCGPETPKSLHPWKDIWVLTIHNSQITTFCHSHFMLEILAQIILKMTSQMSFTSLNCFPSGLALPNTLTSSKSSMSFSYLFVLFVHGFILAHYIWISVRVGALSITLYYFSKVSFILDNVFFLKSKRFLWLFKNE